MIALPPFPDEEMEATRVYTVGLPWNYLEVGVRKTIPWAKFTSVQT